MPRRIPARKPETKPETKNGKKPGLFFNFKNSLSNISSIPLSEKLFFINHLQVLVRAGLSISESLKTLSEQTENARFKNILTIIQTGIEKGETLSANMAKFPKVFPKIFVSMVGAGEMSGTLEENLKELATQMKKEHNLRSKIKTALTYPVVVVVATVTILTLMIVFIIPKIVSIFAEMKAQLPLPTRMLIAADTFILEHYILFILIIAATIGFFIFIIRLPAGKRVLHFLFLKSPILGPIIKKVNIARFSRTLSSLLKTDIPVVQSFATTAEVLGNVHYKKIVSDASLKLKKGVSVSESIMNDSKLFPPVVVQMIDIGEKSGNLDTLLEELAIFYEDQVDDTVKSLSSIIEPILILFLGVVVGGIALAIIAPMYSLSQQI